MGNNESSGVPSTASLRIRLRRRRWVLWAGAIAAYLLGGLLGFVVFGRASPWYFVIDIVVALLVLVMGLRENRLVITLFIVWTAVGALSQFAGHDIDQALIVFACSAAAGALAIGYAWVLRQATEQ